jgi:hypothetical protein
MVEGGAKVEEVENKEMAKVAMMDVHVYCFLHDKLQSWNGYNVKNSTSLKDNPNQWTLGMYIITYLQTDIKQILKPD